MTSKKESDRYHIGLVEYTNVLLLSIKQIADQSASPGDPLFFLHHTNLDRLWWQWQSADLPARLEQMGGRNVPANSSLLIGKWLYPSDDVLNYDGDPANVTTMNHVGRASISIYIHRHLPMLRAMQVVFRISD